ncbi:ABC transporter permease [Microbacterium sp. LWH7-1.2]|jgi:sulfonate transport system permease protein|uniref:ABC transporter permease n=1 Tax=Microbacterium sp. LWH7-1.2 TaxID=3135257 RepID=UPI00313A38EB
MTTQTSSIGTRSEAGSLAPQPRRAPKRTHWWSRIKPLRAAGPIIVLVLWQLTTMTGLVPPTVLPPPSEVFTTGWELWQTGELQIHLLISLQRIGYAVVLGVSIGLVLAILAGLWKVGDALIDPLMQMMRTVPVLALVPLFILWFGIGEPSKVLMIALAVVFPVYLNTYAGIRGVDRKLMEVGTIVHLSSMGRIRHIVLPGALPGFLTGLRMSLGVAWLILVISEQVNATEGIGYLMNNARLYLRTDVIVLGILIYALAGYLSDLLVRLIEKRALSWRQGLETV